MLVHQQPRSTSNWVRIAARRIRHRKTEVVGNISGAERRGHRFQCRFHKLPCGILDVGIWHLVLHRVNQLHVPERAWRLLHLSRHTLISFAPDACWPIDRCIVADLLFPLRADLAQVIGEYERRPTAIRAMHNHDFLVRQLCSWIRRRDFWIIPFFDFAQENVGDRFAIEFERWITLEVVSHHDGARDGRDMQDLPRRF